MARLRRIDRAAGQEARHADQLPQLLEALRHEARVESVTASNAIEGVVVADARVSKLVSRDPGRLRDRNEQEFAGYSAALDYLQQGDAGGLTVGLVLHLHRMLFAFGDGGGGRLKVDENRVVNRHPDGTTSIRFEPVPAADTPFFLTELIGRTNDALADEMVHPLIATSAFVLDFLCIHPFGDGNGRTARLLTGHLLESQGYGVGRYISLEQLMYDSRSDYYRALEASTNGWFDDGAHELWPWAGYLLDCIEDAYDRFGTRITHSVTGGTKQSRVRDAVLLHLAATFTIADIRRAVPGVSDNTIRLVLAELKRSGHVENDGTGRSAEWRRR